MDSYGPKSTDYPDASNLRFRKNCGRELIRSAVPAKLNISRGLKRTHGFREFCDLSIVCSKLAELQHLEPFWGLFMLAPTAFFRGFFMTYLWWCGFIITLIRSYFWYRKSRREKFPFQIWQWVTIFAFGILFYYRDVPSFGRPGLHHQVSQEEIMDGLKENVFNFHYLVDEGDRLYDQGEIGWAYIEFQHAEKTRLGEFNEFYVYYIATLLKMGKLDEANEKERQMFDDIRSGAAIGRWPSTKDGLKHYFENCYDAKKQLSQSDGKVLNSMMYQLNVFYQQTLTNSPEKP